MKCTKFCEIISIFVDAEATPLEQLALQEHLKSCPACKEELVSQYSLKDMMQEYHNKVCCAADVNISSKVMAKILAPKREEPETDYKFSFSKYSRWAVATFVIALAAATIFSAHVDDIHVASSTDKNAKEYANYIYEHVNDADNGMVTSRNTQFKQVSLIK